MVSPVHLQPPVMTDWDSGEVISCVSASVCGTKIPAVVSTASHSLTETHKAEAEGVKLQHMHASLCLLNQNGKKKKKTSEGRKFSSADNRHLQAIWCTKATDGEFGGGRQLRKIFPQKACSALTVVKIIIRSG